jgi:hypothetical protein
MQHDTETPSVPAGTTHLEIGGCRETPEGVCGGVPAGEAEFFTVYARTGDGPAQALSDHATLDAARAAAGRLARTAGLNVVDYRLAQ